MHGRCVEEQRVRNEGSGSRGAIDRRSRLTTGSRAFSCSTAIAPSGSPGVDDLPTRLGGSKLLWIDIPETSEDAARSVAAELDLDEIASRSLASTSQTPSFRDAGRLRAPDDPRAGRKRVGRADGDRMPDRRELGRHRPRPTGRRAGRVRRAGVRLRPDRGDGRPVVRRRPARDGSSTSTRRPSTASRRSWRTSTSARCRVWGDPRTRSSASSACAGAQPVSDARSRRTVPCSSR